MPSPDTMSSVVVEGAGVAQASGQVAAEPMMDVEHLTRAVVYMASLPLVNMVLSLIVMATKMLVGRSGWAGRLRKAQEGCWIGCYAALPARGGSGGRPAVLFSAFSCLNQTIK
jgi:hypothetical protein